MTTMGDTSKTRRPKGTGSIFPTREGTFRASIKLKDAQGNPEPHTKRFKTQREAEKWLDDLVARHRGGALNRLPTQTNATVRDLLRNWIIHKYNEAETSGKPSVSSVQDYDGQIRTWVIPKLGNIELNRLHKDNIYEWLNFLNTAVSPTTGKLLSNDRKHRVWGVLKQSMTYAVNEGYLDRNPLNGVKGPTQKHHDLLERVMTESDYQKFVSYIHEKGCDHASGYCELRWLLGIKGARRQGEVLGLYWSYCHLNEDPPYIQIDGRLKAKKWFHDCGDPVISAVTGKPVYPCGEKTAVKCSQPIKGGLTIVDGTKGGENNRPRLPVGEFLDAFREHRTQQHAELMKAKEEGTYSLLSPEHEGLVFTQVNGRPWQPRQDNKIFMRLLEEAGIKGTYRLHDLRHTAISRLVDATSNIRLAQEIAGHKTLLITGRYAKPSLASADDAFQQLREMDKRKADELERKKKRERAINW